MGRGRSWCPGLHGAPPAARATPGGTAGTAPRGIYRVRTYRNHRNGRALSLYLFIVGVPPQKRSSSDPAGPLRRVEAAGSQTCRWPSVPWATWARDGANGGFQRVLLPQWSHVPLPPPVPQTHTWILGCRIPAVAGAAPWRLGRTRREPIGRGGAQGGDQAAL